MGGPRPPARAGAAPDRSWASDATPLALLALAPLVMLWPFLFQGQVMYYRDITQVYQPDVAFLVRSLAAGQLPWWNPLVAGGYPHLAGLEPSFYYPGCLLFLLLPFGPALALSLALHQLLAGWAMYALGRAWGWRREAAALAAACYACSGYVAASGQLYPLVPRAAWFPLVALAFERALRGRGVAPLVAGWALALSLARPDTTLIELLPLGALALARGWPAAGAAKARPAALLLAALAAALALNAASVLPAAEFVAHSNREGGISLGERQIYSFPPLALLTLAAPGLFGDVEWGTDWGRYFVGEPQASFSPYYLSVYLGWLPWLLLPLAWRARRDGRWLCLLAGAGLTLALGRYLPAFGWFAHLPGAGFLRYPAKFMFVATWALAAAAGAGADELLRRPDRHRRLAAATIAAAGAALLVWATAWAWPDRWIAGLSALDYRALAAGPLDFDPNLYMARLWPAIFPDARAELGTALATACLCAGLLAAAGRPAGRLGRVAPQLLVLVALAEMVARNRGYNFAAPAGYFERVPPVVAAARALGGEGYRFLKPLGQTERLGIARENRRADMARAGDVPYALAYARGLQDRLSVRAALSYGLAGVYGGTNITPFFSATYLLQNVDRLTPGGAPAGRLAAVAGMLNVRWLLVPFAPQPGGQVPPLPVRLRDPAFPEIWRDAAGGELLLETPRAQPRAYLVPRAVVVPGLDAATRATGDLDPAQVVILEQMPPPAPGAGTAPAAAPAARVLAAGNQHVEVAVAAPRGGFLVLADNYYPGWHATLDGRPAPILRANVVSRAVAVPPGSHLVRFTYRPISIAAGAAISLGGWALLLALWARRRRAA